ncbi:MAG: hypothetical protein JNK87_22995 [Bryobacterales bacterium]|nr:hypothetical protein [Bryobacterales bacterium]
MITLSIPILLAAVVTPTVAAAAAAEAALLAILALIALMILIQSLPFMGRKLEELARQIQILMATIIEQVKKGIEGIEDLVKRNTRAGMRCSAELIAFRKVSQELLDFLAAPRATDELGRARFERDLVEKFGRWQAATQALLECLMAHGAS